MPQRYQIHRQKAIQKFRHLVAEQNPTIQLLLPMSEVVSLLQEGVGNLLREAGLQLMCLIMEEEVRQLAGERNRPDHPHGNAWPSRRTWWKRGGLPGLRAGCVVITGQVIQVDGGWTLKGHTPDLRDPGRLLGSRPACAAKSLKHPSARPAARSEGCATRMCEVGNASRSFHDESLARLRGVALYYRVSGGLTWGPAILNGENKSVAPAVSCNGGRCAISKGDRIQDLGPATEHDG